MSKQSKQPKPIKEPIDELTDAQVQKLIAMRKKAGATSCEVVTEGGKKFLVTQYPPLSVK